MIPNPTTWFSLPAELRLYIAAYVLEQPYNAGLLYNDDTGEDSTGIFDRFSDEGNVPGFHLNLRYSAADNLSILHVCRQFHTDFLNLAYQKTRFVLILHPQEVISRQPGELLRNLRKLAIQCNLSTLAAWGQWPFHYDQLHLDELCIALRHDNRKYVVLVKLMRNIRNVKSIRFIHHSLGKWEDRVDCNRLVGAILKEDHYQRYDAPNAPNPEATWWSWSNIGKSNFTFVAQESKPIMEEETYMEFVKPMVNEAIRNMATES